MKLTTILATIMMLISVKVYSAERDSTMVLDSLVMQLMTNNPDLKSYQEKLQAAQAAIPQAGALPDPVLSLGLMNVPVDNFVFNQQPMSGKQLSLMQMIPFPGKLGLQQKIAVDDAEIERGHYAARRNSLIYELKSTYYELFYIHKSIQTNQTNTEVLKQLLRIAETRYRLGKGIQQDILKTQVSISNLMDVLLNLRQKKRALEAHLNFLLNRSPKTFPGNPAEIEPGNFQYTLEELRSLAEENNPELLIRQTAITQNERRVSLSKKGYLPDLSLQVSYTQREELENGMPGVDFLSGMVNVTLPVYFWKKQKKQVEENRLMKMSAGSQYESTLRRIVQDLEISLEELRKNEKRMILFESGILPQARQALQSSLSAYQVDKVDFLSVLDNQMNLYEYELEFYRALTDFYIDIARLEEISGSELKVNVQKD